MPIILAPKAAKIAAKEQFFGQHPVDCRFFLRTQHREIFSNELLKNAFKSNFTGVDTRYMISLKFSKIDKWPNPRTFQLDNQSEGWLFLISDKFLISTPENKNYIPSKVST